MRILVVEDERALCETIVRSLRRLAYSVDPCYDGDTAIDLLGSERYDLVLLDLNLPGADGMTVLRTLRQTDRETRVLILSARSEVEDKVQGLDAGANDYLAKPFHLAELEARIRSLTLRQFTQQDVLLSCGGLTFDTRSRTAAVNGQTLTLTRKETGILEYLMVHQGRPVSQEELMDHVWDNSVDSFSNSIRVHISALRKKLRAVLGYSPLKDLNVYRVSIAEPPFKAVRRYFVNIGSTSVSSDAHTPSHPSDTFSHPHAAPAPHTPPGHGQSANPVLTADTYSQ